MSGFVLLCVDCDWSIVLENPLDALDKADGHLDVCDGPPTPSPFDGTGLEAS